MGAGARGQIGHPARNHAGIERTNRNLLKSVTEIVIHQNQQWAEDRAQESTLKKLNVTLRLVLLMEGGMYEYFD